MTKHLLRSTLTLSVLSAMVSLSHANEAAETADESAVKMETIVVSASGSQVNVKDAPASISVVTKEDIQRQPFNSLADVLSDLPGVTGGYSNAGAGSKITFRGMPDKYTLILVDGKRIGNQSLLGHRPDKVDQDLNWITPDMIERIEVIRGSMSTLYGSEAVGGVINIITKKIPNKLTGSATVNYSKPDSSSRGETEQYGATVSGPINDHFGFRLGVNRTDRAADSDADGGTSGSVADTVNGRLTWMLSDAQTLNLDASWGNDKSETIETAGEQFGYEMERYGFGIGHEGHFANGLNTNIDLYYNEIQNNDQSFVDDEKVETKATETVLDLKATQERQVFGKRNDLTVGAQYKYEQVSNSSNIGNLGLDVDGNELVNNDLEPDTYSWSVFAEDQIHLQDNLILTLGGRLDNYETFDLNFSPRGYLVYHPTEAWTVKGGVSRSFRAPNLRERSGTSSTGSMGMGCSSLISIGYPGGGCQMLGNPDLEPETSTNYEIGFGYAEDGYGLDVTYFLSDIQDLIQNRQLGIAPNGTWYTTQRNVEEARTSGIEMTFKLPFTTTVSFNGNATYMLESKNKVTGESLLETPEITLNGTLLWDVTDKLNLHAKVQYLGRQNIEIGDDTPTFAKPYTTGDVGFNYVVNDHFTFRGGVQNVAGVKVDTGSDYGTSNPAVYYAGFTTRF
ncbi:TonB-dependent receptor [Acinetobacter sp. ANC 4945]|uniref:TonB-dependent receptor n=1 Tax=Acinetobacter amyesii TaxID=2942470 RepID=A0A1T1H0U5_9GAMM|nr:TonB-dependent receptor [Acinetobacter amyesii]MCL6247702.1 TonB-dependent receptor [Acinetobacter amyesii]OOV83476.1 TonB-dependent receptor [Acinetobacter amyesii]